MSTFEKIVIPFMDCSMTTIDFTAAAGFIDSYTSDPDKPDGENNIYLVYDDTIRNDYVTSRVNRFNKSKLLKRKYVKMVNNTPYYIYVFCVKPGLKASTNGIIHLTKDEKVTVLQFWNFSNDMVNVLMSDSSIATKYTHEMPLEDYYPDNYNNEGIIIKKEEASS